MPIGVITNNPGNLTTFGPNSFIYPGQTGNYSANGLTYAVFPDAHTGASALTDYLNRNTGNYSSLSDFGKAYSGGDPNWTTNVATSLGVSTSTPPNTINVNSLGAAIQNAEGNNGLGNLFNTGSGNSGDPYAVQTASGPIGGPGANASQTVGSSPGTVAGSSTGGSGDQTTALTGLDNLAAVGQKFLSFFTIQNWERGAFVFLGIALALIAVAVLIFENKTVQETTARVAKVAATVA